MWSINFSEKAFVTTQMIECFFFTPGNYCTNYIRDPTYAFTVPRLSMSEDYQNRLQK